MNLLLRPANWWAPSPRLRRWEITDEMRRLQDEDILAVILAMSRSTSGGLMTTTGNVT